MVPLDREHRFRERALSEPHIRVLHSLLMKEAVEHRLPVLDDTHELDKIYYGIVSAISSSNAHSFDLNYSELSRRVVDPESPQPFVNNDFLLFAVVLGVKVFSRSDQWIRSTLAARQSSRMKDTLLNLLNGDLQNTNSSACISLCFGSLLIGRPITDELVNRAYAEAVGSPDLFDNRSELTILCSLRARDLAFELKGLDGGGEIGSLVEFEKRFWERTRYLAYGLGLALGLVLLFKAFQAARSSSEIQEAVSLLESILGIVGLGLFGWMFYRVRKWIHRGLLLALGYPSSLLRMRRSLREKE